MIHLQKAEWRSYYGYNILLLVRHANGMQHAILPHLPPLHATNGRGLRQLSTFIKNSHINNITAYVSQQMTIITTITSASLKIIITKAYLFNKKWCLTGMVAKYNNVSNDKQQTSTLQILAQDYLTPLAFSRPFTTLANTINELLTVYQHHRQDRLKYWTPHQASLT